MLFSKFFKVKVPPPFPGRRHSSRMARLFIIFKIKFGFTHHRIFSNRNACIIIEFYESLYFENDTNVL